MPPIDMTARRTIEIVADPNDRLQRGQIAVHSDVRTSGAEYAGAPTMLVTTVTPAVAVAPAAAPAILTIDDMEGRRDHVIVDNPTLVGRGGEGCNVHVRLRTDGHVSKQHCCLTRDEASGRFFIKDLSHNGTFVDGQRLPPAVDVRLPERAYIGLAGTLLLEFTQTRNT
jgi:hypothetical protein